jgi:phosphoribosylaminoimidazole-succinocarboxamide synthase
MNDAAMNEAIRATLLAQLPHTLDRTDLPGLGTRTEGKVRDVYVDGDRMFLVATDRLSAFDRVLSTVPFKGEVLTRTALYWFEHTRDIVENHVLDAPDPSVMVVRRCEPLPVEVVVRGYLTGSLWRDYEAGRHGAYGLSLPGGMRRDDAFDAPILTPTTKAERGEHDAPISRDEIIGRGLVDEAVYAECERIALALYARGVEMAADRGLILVDTKYELGLVDGRVVLMDEIHTPDSSRYWVAEGYAARLAEGAPQRMLDKENIRQWLIQTHGYQGDGPPPAIPDAVRVDLAAIYLDAYRRITGEDLVLEGGPVAERIRRNLSAAGYLS